MFPLLFRIAKFLFVAVATVFAAAFALFGVVFVINMYNMHGPKAVIPAPGGGWTVTLSETRFTGTIAKFASVSVHRGSMKGHELMCRMDQTWTDRELFGRVVSTSWRDDDLKLDWTAGDPPVEGTLDIAAQCSNTAVFDDRPSGTSLRFHETCIVPGCARWIEWVESGGEIVKTPCRTTATGDEPVFTDARDVTGQIDVTLDPEARVVAWTSRDTGQSGRVDFADDCDVTKQVRSPRPS